jgi:hypothetical protein
MSTNLVRQILTWNLVNNSKSVENQKKLQLQKLFQITSYSSIKFLEIFLTPSYFSYGEFKFQRLNLIFKTNCPLVSGAEASVGPACLVVASAWPPHVAALVSASGLKPPSASLRHSLLPSLRVGHRRATASISGVGRLTPLLVCPCRSPCRSPSRSSRRSHARSRSSCHRPPAWGITAGVHSSCRVPPSTPSAPTHALVIHRHPCILSYRRHADVVTVGVPPVAV